MQSTLGALKNGLKSPKQAICMPRRQGRGLMRMEVFGEDMECCWFGDLVLSRGAARESSLLAQPGFSPPRGQGTEAVLSGLSRDCSQPSLVQRVPRPSLPPQHGHCRCVCRVLMGSLRPEPQRAAV